MKLRSTMFGLMLGWISALGSALAQPGSPGTSPQIHDDGRVTFRLHAPQATQVSVVGEIGDEVPMTREAESGKWSATVGPLTPDIYGYSFKVDRLRITDPGNPWTKPQRESFTSVLHLPANPPALWDSLAPREKRGEVHLHDYSSANLKTERRFRVYTPAGYTTETATDYPALFLFHGSGDNEATWTEFGRAHIILDHLIAQRRAVPMIVVMVDGHPLGRIPREAAERRTQAQEAFEAELFEEIIPQVEKTYRISKDREKRAVAGLSMGAGHAVAIGLGHLEQFAWIGFMSGGDSSHIIKNSDGAAVAINEKLRLFWIAIGRDDYLLESIQKFRTTLKERHIEHEWKLTDGGHTWQVWRRHLAEFAPLLFR